MKKVHPFSFQVTQSSEQGNSTLSHCGDCPSGGGGGIAEAPRSVITYLYQVF